MSSLVHPEQSEMAGSLAHPEGGGIDPTTVVENLQPQ